VSAVNWLNNEELFLIYSPQGNGDGSEYLFAATDKAYSSFTFRRTPFEPVYPSIDGPTRTIPPRFSMQRLRNWEPALDDMIIVTAAHSSDVGVITRSQQPIDSKVPTVNEFQLAGLQDHRKSTVPRNLEDSADSALIGEALDLSAKEKAWKPSARLEEIDESPTPLPAYFLLTHEGLLGAYWVVWDRALEAGTAYQGLIAGESPATVNQTAPAPQPAQPSSISELAAPTQSSPFASAQFTPAFGKPSFGSPSAPASSLGFGKPGFSGATPSAGPTGSPAFGTPGLGGQRSAFGAPSQISAKPNPFGSGGSASQTSKIANPFAAGGSAAQTDKPNPFAAAAAKFGSGSSGASPFSSFNTNKDGQSGFGGLGQKSGSGFGSFGQKSESGFGGLGQKPLSSFGSTVTVDSKATGPGSTLPSLSDTPAQQSSSIFGSGAASSFPSFASTQSGSTDVSNRGRDEATPTPQPQPHLKEIAGVAGGKFELKSTFKGDGSAKDDLPKPATASGGSLFGSGFGSALTSAASKPPATPAKDTGKAPLFASTTPATAPRPSNGIFGMRADSATPKPAPKEVIPEEAPLPPDWGTAKPSKKDDEIPPLAGSPPIKIEAPSSSGDMEEIPSSPLGNEEDGDLSNPEEDEEGEEEEELSEEEEEEEEEQTGDEGSEQSVPSQQPKPSLFGNRANAAPNLFPAAPTPPPQKAQRPPTNQSLSSSSIFSGTRRDPLTSSVRPQSKSPTPQPVFSDLVDDEDERIRQELESEIEPTRTLAPFIARQEYTEAALNKTGHAAQIEIVYRDINSMVDTLGLNSRTLQAFIEFHEQPQRDSQLDRSALEEVLDDGQDGSWFEKWSMCEIEDLIDLEDQLTHELSAGGMTKVVDKLSKAVRLIQENAKLQSKVNEERRRIINSKDPEKLEALRKASLPKELADQQKALRRDYAQLLTQLGKVEDALILLRSKLASHNANNGHTSAVPSVEAIKKTINKLIDITKDKNHDITLLESQLRKANLFEGSRPTSVSSRHAETPLRKSRALRNESPVGTPPASRKSFSLRELNQVAMTPEQSETPSKGYGLFYTPQGSLSGGRNLSSLADMVDDDLERLRETARRRKNIADRLKSVLADRGVKRMTAV
jgi:nucleoporin NUP159